MKFPFSRLFGASPRSRSARRRPDRRRGRSALRPKALPLSLEALEDRTVLSALPPPVLATPQNALPVIATSTADKGVTGTVVQDPVNPLKMIQVFTYANSLPSPANPKTLVAGAFSINGGQSWTLFTMPANQGDPNTDDGNGREFPFSQTTDASAAIDRNENLYVVYSEHDDANNSGLLIEQKFTWTTNAAPTQTNVPAAGQNNVLAQYFNGEKDLNPVVAVDNNVPTFSDTTPGGSTVTQTDTMVGKAVYVAFTHVDVAPVSPGEASSGATFNPDTVKVIASADGGLTFTTQQYVNDGGPGPVVLNPVTGARKGDPNYTTANPVHHFANPQILFTQGTADGRIKGGQLIFVWNDFGNNTVVSDTSAPDGGVAAAPPASAAVFTANQRNPDGSSGLNGTVVDDQGNTLPSTTFGGITDAETNSSGVGPPNFAVTTSFTQTLTSLPADFTTVADLDVALAAYLPHTNEMSITITARDAAGNILGTFPVTRPPTTSVTLVADRTPVSGTTPTIPPPAQGLPDLAGIGGIVTNANPLHWHPAELVFDQQAARAINDPGLSATPAGFPFVGHFRPEDDSTIFGGAPNLNGGASGIQGLNAYNGLTRSQLLNSTWTISFTDHVSEGQNPPPQFLSYWKLEFSSNISTTGFGKDVTVASPFGDKPLPALVPGSATAPYPTTTTASTIGLPPGIAIAQDKTLGAFSPFEGRVYIAYVSQGFAFAGGSAGATGFTDNSNITLVASDNAGQSWNAISYSSPTGTNPGRLGHDVTINDDNPAVDGFSEGTRPKFDPVLSDDPVTGTLTAAWYDSRYDAARARVATFYADSIDGGNTFSKNVFLNQSVKAVDAIGAAATGVNASTVTLEPIPANMAAANDPLGFGLHIGLASYGGRSTVVWTGNLNSAGDQTFYAIVNYANGPRIIAGDQGPVTQDLSVDGVTYNNTFDPNTGTRQLTGFVVTFDRPVDVSTFTTAQVQAFFHDTTTPAGGGNVPMNVLSVTALDATTKFGPNQVGGLDHFGNPTLATQFLVKLIDPATGLAPSRVGTYSYSVGPTIRDRVRSGSNQVDSSGPPRDVPSNDTPQNITTAPTPTTLNDVITVTGVPGADVVSNVTVDVNITYPNVEDLRLSLIAPDGTRILLVRENSAFGPNYGTPTTDTTFDDIAPTPIANGTAPFAGRFIPQQPLAGFIGGAPNGNWTLEIVDTFTGQLTTGTLNHWTLHLKTGIPGGTTSPGNFMDMNQNTRTGEAPSFNSLGDEFVIPTPLPGNAPFNLPYSQDTLPLIIPGPHLAAGTPGGTVVTGTFVNGKPATPDNLVLNGTNNSIDIVFDRNMNPATVANAALLRMVGPTGPISGLSITPDPNPGFARLIGDTLTTAADPDTTHPRTYRITFPTQQYSGTYTVSLAPTMTDTLGNAVDSNLNAGLDVLRGTSQLSPTVVGVSSITLSGNVATVTTTQPHSFNSGEEIIIAGAVQQQYDGEFTISVTSPTTFTYTVTGSPSSPAAGTITATRPFAVLRVYDSKDPKTNGNTPVQILPGRRAIGTITVPDAFAIQKATLQLNIVDNSTVSGDALDPHLTAQLVGPDGTTVTLFTKVGDTRRPNGFLNTVLDDTAGTPIQQGVPPFNQGAFQPQTPLSALVGKGSKGTYTLYIFNDATNQNITGTLTDWSLNLSQPAVLSGLGEPVADQFAASFRIFTMLQTNPLSHNQWTAVGPAAENAPGEGLNGQNSGRIGALAVDPSDTSGNTVYVGGASGGVWKTTNFLTTSPTGPTYMPLTDFGPSTSLNMGGIAVFPRNNDPRQTIIFAATGEGDTGSPGVGVLRSMDGGVTWQVLDSSSNTTDKHLFQGTLTPVNSPLRDHMFVGNNSFQIAVDPTLSPDGQVVVYLASSGPNGGVWISRDSGLHWGILAKDTNPGPENGQFMTTGAANVAGNATSVALSAGSADAGSKMLQGVFAGIQGQGVFVSTNQGFSFTQSAPVGQPFQGNNLIIDDNTSLQVTVSNPSDNPNGAKGRIALATPAPSGNPQQDFLLQGWVYAAVVTTTGHLNGLYLSKDYGDNWTKVRLPEFQFGTVGIPPRVAFGVPSNNEALVTDADPLGSAKFAQGNYDVSLAVDPTNPYVAYLGGTEDGQIFIQGGLIRVDTTKMFDAKAFVAYDNSNATDPGTPPLIGPVQSLTLGGVNVDRQGRQISLNNANDPFPQNILSLERDPNNPFFLQNSTIHVINANNFTNDGTGATWTPFNFDDILQGSTDQHRVIAMKDPVTGHARLIFGDDQGVFTGVDAGNGQLVESVGGISDQNDPTGDTPVVTGSRNGNLQIVQFYNGAAQPSILAAEIAGAQFYGMAQDDGFPQSDALVLSNGNLNWTGPTGDGTDVATDQTGSGTTYFYKWPCCLGGEGGVTNGFGPTDFFQVGVPGIGLISRTGGNGSNLVRAGDDPANNVGEWPFVNVGFSDQRVIGNFAVNPIDPNAMVITSLTGRVFRTTDQGKDWFVIGGGSTDTSVDLDGSYAPAMAFGAPDPNVTSGNLDNFIYAGTENGNVFVTFTGGGFNGSTKWKNISGGTLGTAGALDGSSVQAFATDPRRGSHDLFAVTLRGVYYMADSSAANPTWQNITGNLFSITFNPFNDPTLTQVRLKYLTSIVADWRYAIPNNLNNPGGPAHPVLYVGGEGGVYRTVDPFNTGGNQWTVFPAVNESGGGANQDGGMLANAHITSLTIETGNVNPANGVPTQQQGPDILMANTYGRGQFAIRLPVDGQILANGTQYRSTYLTSADGPRVINDVPSGPSAGDVNSVTVTFNGPIEPLTIQTPSGTTAGVAPATVARLVGPGNTPIVITSIVDVTPPPAAGSPDLHNVYQISFADQTAPGVYVLTLGPNITDLAGDPMDQNQNGSNGEPGVDTFTANFFLNTRAPDTVTHPTPPVPGVVAAVTSGGGVLPTNGIETLTPTPTTSTGYQASVQGVFPALPPGQTYVDFVSGDFNGDGKTDYAARVLQTGVWYVAINNGTGFTATRWGTWGASSNLTWADVRAGYFFGHSQPEAIAGRAVLRFPDGTVAAENWFIAQSNGSLFTTNYAGSWGPENGFTFADVVVGDFNGDGFDDIAGRINAPGQPFNNEQFISLNDTHGAWVNKGAALAGQWTVNGQMGFTVADVRVGDFTGDGKDDLVGLFSQFGYLIVGKAALQSDGSVRMDLEAAHSFWQQWSTGVTWVDVLAGHFDGPGKMDLVERAAETGAVFMSRNFDPNRNYVINPDGQQFAALWSTAITWADTQVLDFNGDGKDDLVSRVAQNGAWFVSYSDIGLPPGDFAPSQYPNGLPVGLFGNKAYPSASNQETAYQSFAAFWTTSATFVTASKLYDL
jgi:subtilisin-like proprotein convertase family protein